MEPKALRDFTTTLAVFVFSVLLSPIAHSQGPLASTAQAKHFTGAELAKTLAASPSPTSPTRHTADLLQGTPYNVTLDRLDGPNNASIHQYAEMYVVREGSGVLITGGALLEPKPLDANTTLGTGISGGSRQTVRAGDVVYIPAGAAHVYERLTPSITYLLVRFPRTDTAPK